MNNYSLNLSNVDATDNENACPSADPSLVDTVIDLVRTDVFLERYSDLSTSPYSTVKFFYKFFIF